MDVLLVPYVTMHNLNIYEGDFDIAIISIKRSSSESHSSHLIRIKNWIHCEEDTSRARINRTD